MDGGYYDEAREWRNWLVRAVAGSPAQMQIMYGLAGERDLTERSLPWLPGYEGSTPVRVVTLPLTNCNSMFSAKWSDALHTARKGSLAPNEAAWHLECALIEHLEQVWNLPDEGLWEVRGHRRCFTHSKVMAWVAFDRAVKAVEDFGLDGPVERWRALRDEVHREVCSRAFRSDQGSFVQYFDGRELDASLLLMPLVGFLPPNDPSILGTVAAVQRRLSVGGLLLRYDTGIRKMACRQVRAPSLPAASGWLTTWCCRVATQKRGRCSNACLRCATMSGCWPKNMTHVPPLSRKLPSSFLARRFDQYGSEFDARCRRDSAHQRGKEELATAGSAVTP